MAEKEMVNGAEYWRDSSNRLILLEDIPEEDRMRDEMVGVIVEEAKNLSKQMAETKSLIYEAVYNYMDMLRSKYGIEPKGKKGKQHKGNLTFRDFSGRYRITISVSDNIAFDEKIKLAKELIDGCLNRWSENSDKHLVSIVHEAFDVDQAGKISAQKILSLRKIKADDEDWKKAMDLISESVVIDGSKKYVRVHERIEGKEDAWQQISLDMASI